VTSAKPRSLDTAPSLGLQIVSNYISLEQETQARNIAAWTPVVVEVLQGFSGFQDEAVRCVACRPSLV
jgi:brefeldin A-inhibited guanine nucleotide-exchange protein